MQKILSFLFSYFFVGDCDEGAFDFGENIISKFEDGSGSDFVFKFIDSEIVVWLIDKYLGLCMVLWVDKLECVAIIVELDFSFQELGIFLVEIILFSCKQFYR